MANEVNGTTVRIRADISDFEQKIGKVTGKLQSIGKTFGDVGKNLTKKVTLPIMAIGTGAMKVGMDFEKGMSKVSAISGAIGKDLESLTKQAEQLGRTTQFSATQASEAMSYLAMAGMDVNEIMGAMPGMLDLAAASGTDLATTADIVSDALTAFGMEAHEAGRLADIMAKASSTANTNVVMLGESFKYAAPIAREFGMSAEETTGALALMANSGIKASQAGTSLRGALTRLASQPKPVADALNSLSVATTDAQGNMLGFNVIMGQLRDRFAELSEEQRLMYASQIFGKEAMSGMLAVLSASTEEFDEYINVLSNAEGTSKTMAETMNDNLSGALTKLKSALEGAGIAISRVLSPAIEKCVEKINEWVDKFNELDESTQKTIVKVGLIAAGIGPLLIVISKVISAIVVLKNAILAVKGVMAGLKIAALANPIGIIIGVIGALIAVTIRLYKTNEEFRDKVNGIWEQIKALAMSIFGSLKDFWDNWGEDIKAIFKGLFDAIEIILNLMIASFQLGFPLISNVVSATVDTIVNIIGGLIQVLRGLIDFIVGVLTLDWERAWSGLQNIFGGVWNTMVSIVNGAGKIIMGIVNGIISGIKTAIGWLDKLLRRNKSDKNTSVDVGVSAGFGGGAGFDENLSWYAKGGLFNGASVIGVGEDTGVKEAVIPLSGMHMKPFASAIANAMGGSGGITLNQNIYSPKHLNPSDVKVRTLEAGKQLAVEMGVI